MATIARAVFAAEAVVDRTGAWSMVDKAPLPLKMYGPLPLEERGANESRTALSAKASNRPPDDLCRIPTKVLRGRHPDCSWRAEVCGPVGLWHPMGPGLVAPVQLG